MRPKKNLILLTHTFPYGVGEAFLESEINYLLQGFDKVVVIARNVKDSRSRYQAPNFYSHQINPKSDLKEIVFSIFLLIRNLSRSLRYIRNELLILKLKKKRLSRKVLAIMITDLLKSLIAAQAIKRVMRIHELTGDLILYSYWLSSLALATTFVRSKSSQIRRVARAHHSDLYEHINPSRYLSYRQALAQELNGIYSISMHGLEYLRTIVPEKTHKHLFCSKLGTEPLIVKTQQRPAVHHLIVSCSFLQKIKLVELIVEALSLIEVLPIYWIHFGDGPQREMVEQLAIKKLANKKNIRYLFHGEFANPTLLKFYQENFVSLLVNTSSSEGIPVSIMEAQSCGVPCIGMDVGGVREIISKERGLLLSPDATPLQIAETINSVLTLPEEAYTELRASAFVNWDTNFNAKKNFPAFIQAIQNI
ncbi:MAG: glycosyltransferase [Bacteroidetes bacterium]|nr:glycosyltransferase [Bacteroidota bacterium]